MKENISAKECKKGTSYRVIVRVQEDGRMRTITKTFPSWQYSSKKEALKAATIFRDVSKAKLNKHQPITNNRATLEDIVALKKRTFIHAPETERHHDIIINKYIYPVIPKDTKFSSITYLDLNQIFNKARSKCTQNYLNRIKSVLDQLYRSALMNDLIEVNQVDKVIIPNSTKQENHRKRYTSKSEVDDVIKALDRVKDKEKASLIKLAIEIMRYTGIRTSEVLALNREDFDLESGLLTINKGIRLDDRRKAFVSTYKTSSSWRVLPIDDRLYPFIEKAPQGALFELRGAYLTTLDISEVIRSVYKGFNLYQLRHQFATDLVKIADLGTVQSLMGHSSPSTTIGYVQANLEDMKNALKRRKI